MLGLANFATALNFSFMSSVAVACHLFKSFAADFHPSRMPASCAFMPLDSPSALNRLNTLKELKILDHPLRQTSPATDPTQHPAASAPAAATSTPAAAPSADDGDMLEDLIVAAHEDARRKAENLMAEKMKDMTAGLPLPPGMKLPF